MAGDDLDDRADAPRSQDAEVAAKRRPVRTCVGCRQKAAKDELLRVVASEREPGSAVVPDPGGRAPGRGAYLHLAEACLRLALRKRAFPRALRVRGPLADEDLAAYVAQIEHFPDRNDRENVEQQLMSTR